MAVWRRWLVDRRPADPQTAETEHAPRIVSIAVAAGRMECAIALQEIDGQRKVILLNAVCAQDLARQVFRAGIALGWIDETTGEIVPAPRPDA